MELDVIKAGNGRITTGKNIIKKRKKEMRK
jgi:hypothetical protein